MSVAAQDGSQANTGGDYTANLAGALALAVTDAMHRAIEGDPPGSGSGAVVRIGTHPGQSITFLAESLQLSHSATVRMIDRLQERGLVRRGAMAGPAAEDGRAVGLYLTEAGEAERDALVEHRYAAIEPLLATLTEEERTILREIARKMITVAATPEVAGSVCRLCDVPVCIEAGCPVPVPAFLRDAPSD